MMKKNIFALSKIPLLSLTVFSTIPAIAIDDYKRIAACGSASVISGDTCSNVKVEFKFNGCEIKSEPQIAKRILCEKQIIKARFQEGVYRYEAQFQKTDDGWGGVSWKPLGSVTQYSKDNLDANASAHQAVERLPTEASQPAPVLTSAASPFKFGGFADLRYTNFTTKNSPLVTSGNPESGFGIEDGAFYGNYEKEKLSVVLDVAFRRSKDVDTNSSATKPAQSSNGNIAIGVDRSQLYLKYKLTKNFNVNFGQFDTIYGVELNDSKDRIFGKTGLVYDYTLPVTHTGLMLEFSTNGFYAKTFAANPNNKGSFGSSTAGDEKAEYGMALGYSSEIIRGQAGYMSRSISKASGAGYGDRSLLDLIVGTTIGSFSLDLEYSRVTDPNKNTLTAVNSTDLEDSGYGMLALASYKFTDSLLIGTRYEIIKDDPSVSSVKSMTAVGGSVHYKLYPELELRTEYIGYNAKAVNDATWKESRFNVAALLSF